MYTRFYSGLKLRVQHTCTKENLSMINIEHSNAIKKGPPTFKHTEHLKCY